MCWSASSSVSSRSPCSPSQSTVCRTQQGLICARGIPIGARGGQAAHAGAGSARRLLPTGTFFPTVPARSTVGKNVPVARARRRDPSRGAACHGGIELHCKAVPVYQYSCMRYISTDDLRITDLIIRIDHACVNRQNPGGRGARGAAAILPAPVCLGRVMCSYCEFAAGIQGGGTRQCG